MFFFLHTHAHTLIFSLSHTHTHTHSLRPTFVVVVVDVREDDSILGRAVLFGLHPIVIPVVVVVVHCRWWWWWRRRDRRLPLEDDDDECIDDVDIHSLEQKHIRYFILPNASSLDAIDRDRMDFKSMCFLSPNHCPLHWKSDESLAYSFQFFICFRFVFVDK